MEMDKKTKKRILCFIPEFPRLTETFIEREIRKLLELGNTDISVLALQKASGYASPEVLKVTHYRRLDFFTAVKSLKFLLTSPGKVFAAWVVVNNDKTKDFFGRIYLYFKSIGYANLIEPYQPDHIHVHFLSDPSTIVLAVAIILDTPFSISGHARDVFVEGTLLKEKAKLAKFVTICNTFAFDKYLAIVGSSYKDKVYKLFHGVEIREDAQIITDIFRQTRPVVLTVARLVEKKGIKYLIEASALLKESGVAYEIHIVGPGPLYEELKQQIKVQGLESQVVIEGEGKGLPYEQVDKFYQNADVFVLPSIETGGGDADGVPTAVIEAAMHKLPIITTEAGSMADLIENNITGITVPQRDSRALAYEIEKLLRDRNLREKYGRAAEERAKKLFDLTENTLQLERLLLVD